MAQDTNIALCPTCGATYPAGTARCAVDSTPLQQQRTDPLIGVILPRRYRILAPLGEGANSRAYKGVYEPLEQIVVVKMLKTHLIVDETKAKRFQHEIKAAAALVHPNIASVMDFGITDQGVPYIISEFLKGNSLSEVVAMDEHLAVPTAIHIFKQVTDALAFAHDKGIIHRDIKPSNIMICGGQDDNNNVKVLDFGIAKVRQLATGKVTNPDEAADAAMYMSPEQCQGQELDGRTDIYSLGCVIYTTLTGRPPVIGISPADTIKKQVQVMPPPMESVRSDLFFPEKLQELVSRMLVKDPRQRYQFMRQVRMDLDTAGLRQTTDEIHAPATSARLSSASRPFNLIRISVGVGIACFVGVVGWMLFHKEPNQVAAVSHLLPGGEDEAWRQLTSDAQAAYNQGHYQESEDLYQAALKEAKRFKEPDQRMAKSLNSLAYISYQEDKLDAAEQNARDALAIQEKINASDPAIAEILSNLSRILCAEGKFESAKSLMDQALTFKPTEAQSGLDAATALQALAEIECYAGNFESARQHLEKARDITNRAVGDDHPDYARIINDLGMVLEKEKKYKQAEALFDKALGIRQKRLGLEHPAVADSLLAMGTLYFDLKNDGAAKDDFMQALSVRQKNFGEESAPVAEVLSCLAIFYDSERQFDKAEDCYRRAYQIRQKVWGADSPRLVRSLEQLSTFLRSRGEVQGADAYDAQIRRIRAGKSTPKGHTIFDS
jgi:serine/threonine-protein kinase